MMSLYKKLNFLPFATALALSAFSTHVLAATSSQFTHTPPAITGATSAKPIVMLATGNDHQLFYKAYNDWSDLNDDGILDTTYTDTFDYYGYFDHSKCYYISSDIFIPSDVFATGPNSHHCDTNSGTPVARWSGNFLNWVSMSRMDVMRKVLFGGKRNGPAALAAYIDSATNTILERAYIPNDNHAWSKYFPATDLNKYTPFDGATYTNGVTFCNVTPYDGTHEYSEDTTASPRLRVANGKWDLWAAQERVQCMWDAEAPLNLTTAESPASSGAEYIGEYNVQVLACVPDRIGTESCYSYDGGTNHKPVGLLNKYGEANLMDFGLITGSYETGKDGGILRKNISPMSDEINADGTWNSATNGIIATMNKFRISRYSYNDNGYGDNLKDNCPYGQNTWTNGDCANWGNPMGEIYLEALRYFSGASPYNGFRANNDDTWIPGIAHGISWRDPYGAAQTTPVGGGYPACSKPNIINFSTGIFGFDDDNYAGESNVGGSLDTDAQTDIVGNTELDASKTYYIGSKTGGSAADVCSAQSVPNLSAVTGLCPEAPGILGSYKIAGLAYYGHTNDIRPAITTNDVNVNTFSVSMAPPIPDIKVNVGGNTVRIIPVGHNWRDSNSMVLVNFQVISQTATTGEFFMNYENAPAGADHDSDFKGYLKYEVNGNDISITGYNTGSSAGSTMHMGYIIDGVTDPGVHYVASNQDVTSNVQTSGGTYSTTQAAIDADCGALTLPASGSLIRCSSTLVGGTRDLRAARTHTAGTSSSELLKNPLWYAAKWGGFTDINGDGKPLDTLEFDSVNNTTGVPGSDGIPDNYFISQDPSKIEDQLNKVLSQISNRRSAGSAAAVITNTVTSTSMVVQGLYQPEIKSLDQSQTVQWGGFLHTLLLDKELNFREDSDQDGQLDSYATDKVIKFFYDTSQSRTRVARYNTSDGITLTLDSISEIDDVKTLWDARRELAEMNSAVLTSNRTYTAANNLATNSNSQRYIFTWLDADYDGVVDAGEQTEYLDSNFDSTNYGYFHLQADKDGDSDIDADDAKRLVNFTRGVDYSGLRNRTIDFDDDGSNEVWRLGDIIHSSPAIVEKPSGIWRTQYGDTTYDEFTTQYKDRRTVVYVGANDGFLHAFNSGFFDTANKSYGLTRAQAAHESAAPASHKLGAEIWAYAPKNLLPHMQWLSEVGYPNHVYYVDGDLKTFDVNIFPDDTDHPNGWGTILVATMRFGGGSDDASNATSLDIDVDGDSTADFKARSSIVILDITNPEQPPKLLAEYNDTNLGLTLSTPELVAYRQPNLVDGDWSNPSVNNWYLVFGSGPTDLSTLLSTQAPSVYAMKLNDIENGTIDISKKTLTTASSYIGKFHTVDWTNNFITDNIYFGVAGGTSADPTGYLARIGTTLTEDNTSYYNLDIGAGTPNWAVSTVINPAQPFIFKPTTTISSGKKWVFAGTGRRLINSDDNITGASNTQSYYGIKENISVTNGLPDGSTYTKGAYAATLTGNELQSVTGLRIFADSSVTDPLTSLPPGESITSFSGLESYLNTVPGWYRDLDTVNTWKERVNADTQLFSQQLLVTTFQPSTVACETSGETNFYTLYTNTGTVHPTSGFGEDSSVTNGGSNLISESTTYSGENFGNVVCIGNNCGIVIQGSGDGDDADADKGGSTGGGTVLENTGNITLNQGRQSWREIYIEEEF